jgi:Tol biopolymer transport system component
MADFQVRDTRPLGDGGTADLRPAWNVDAKSIVWERREGAGAKLLRADLRGDRLVNAAPIEMCNDGATMVQGRAAFFAQDDFAFISNRSGSPAVWRAHLGKGIVEQLTLPFEDEADHGPTARPDSEGHFAFFRIIGAGRPHLFVGRLGETNQPLATGRLDGDQPWFMPQARCLVFHSVRDGDHGLFERDVNVLAKAKRLSSGDEGTRLVTPFPSPDGRHIAFASAVSGTSQIWVMRRDGTDRQQLTTGSEPACFPAWAPNADEVLYVRGEPLGSTGQLMLMRLDRSA